MGSHRLHAVASSHLGLLAAGELLASLASVWAHHHVALRGRLSVPRGLLVLLDGRHHLLRALVGRSARNDVVSCISLHLFFGSVGGGGRLVVEGERRWHGSDRHHLYKDLLGVL